MLSNSCTNQALFLMIILSPNSNEFEGNISIGFCSEVKTVVCCKVRLIYFSSGPIKQPHSPLISTLHI